MPTKNKLAESIYKNIKPGATIKEMIIATKKAINEIEGKDKNWQKFKSYVNKGTKNGNIKND